MYGFENQNLKDSCWYSSIISNVFPQIAKKVRERKSRIPGTAVIFLFSNSLNYDKEDYRGSSQCLRKPEGT